MTVIADNVVDWFQEDIFSKKMGALFAEYLRGNSGALGELLLLLVMIKQKPLGWEKEVERFIIAESKNSFYLHRVFYALESEFQISFSTEKTRHDVKRLSAMALAKHATGVKRPNSALIERMSTALQEEKSKKAKAKVDK